MTYKCGGCGTTQPFDHPAWCGALVPDPATFDARPVRCEARYTLDGEPVDLDDLIRDNQDPDFGFEATDIAQLRALQPGQELRFGGGAAAEFTVRREIVGDDGEVWRPSCGCDLDHTEPGCPEHGWEKKGGEEASR